MNELAIQSVRLKMALRAKLRAEDDLQSSHMMDDSVPGAAYVSAIRELEAQVVEFERLAATHPLTTDDRAREATLEDRLAWLKS